MMDSSILSFSRDGGLSPTLGGVRRGFNIERTGTLSTRTLNLCAERKVQRHSADGTQEQLAYSYELLTMTSRSNYRTTELPNYRTTELPNCHPESKTKLKAANAKAVLLYEHVARHGEDLRPHGGL